MKRGGAKRTISWMAIVAIALQAVLWGVTGPNAAGSTLDPFSVICHSGTQAAPADQAPADQTPAPSQACDHCNLCSATPVALDTLDAVFAGYLTPAKVLDVLSAPAVVTNDGVSSNPRLSQGPPQLT